MVRPAILLWIEQADMVLRDGVTRSELVTLVVIAPGAAKAEVFRLARPACAARNDVIDLADANKQVQRRLAVCAAVGELLAEPVARRFAHGLPGIKDRGVAGARGERPLPIPSPS